MTPLPATGYGARVLADSVSTFGPGGPVRLTTLEVVIPRIVLAEFNTHRQFSRNSASSRAIPVERRIRAAMENPFIPEAFGRNRPGMQATDVLADDEALSAKAEWMRARDEAVKSATALAAMGVHKQLANRLLEPFLWHPLIVSATDYANFFALRCHKDAQPEIRIAAELMRDALAASTPEVTGPDGWHIPLVPDAGELLGKYTPEQIARIGCARCARVSYLTHAGQRDVAEDLTLAERLDVSRHMSPFEHAAQARYDWMTRGTGNFRAPWVQLRKMLPGEAVWG